MKPGLLILPFLALLIAALGTAAAAALPQIHWVAQLAWALALVVVLLWVAMDLNNFKALFQRKGAKYGASSGAAVVLGVVAIVGVAVLTSRPRFNKSYDVTRDRLNTLSDQSTKVIATIKESGEPVKVEVYVSDEKVNADLHDLLGLYQSKGANLQVEYIDPQTHPTQAMAAKVAEGNTVIFRHGKQEKRLTAFTEEKITNAFVNVLKNKSKKIYFTKGHGEGALKGADATGFNTVAMELESNRNSVDELSLLETAKVPEDADMVVIAGPKYELKEEETRILEDYLKRGGSVLTMVGAMAPTQQLNKLIGKFGVQYNQDLLILAPSDVRAQMVGQNNAIISEFDEFSPVTKDFARMSQVQLVMRNTRSLSEVKDNQQKLKVTLAGKTSKDIIRVKNVTSPADLENLTEERWEMGSFPVIAVAVGKSLLPATADASSGSKDAKSDAAKNDAGGAKGRETRLVSVGSVEFANNQGAQMAENRDMFLNMTNYLLQDEDFIAIRPKDPTKSTINLTTSNSQLSLLFLAFIYPFMFLGGGTVAWLKKEKSVKGKLRLAGILAVLVLLLGGLATWDEWKTKQEKEEEQTKNKLAEFKPEDVLELDYESGAPTSDEANGEKAEEHARHDAVQVSAVKKDGLWRLTKPIDALADGATIEGLVNTLHDYAYAKVISDQRSAWAEYGLLEPKRHISLRLGGNQPRTITVYLGSKAPVGYNAYVRTSQDDKVLLGGQHILVATSKMLDDFRDRTLVKINEGKIKNLIYHARGEPEIELTKADGKYQIVLPEKLDADSIAIREFIDNLNQLKVAGFIDAPDEATKDLFAQPAYLLSWQEETGEKSTLKIADKGGKLLAAFDPSQRVYNLPDDFKPKINKTLIDFRNRRILEPDLLDAKTVEIDGEVFKNIEGNWYAAADAAKFDEKGKYQSPDPKDPNKDKPAEKPHVRAFMVDLEFAKTDRFIAADDPVAKALPAAPLHRITLSYFDQSKKQVSIDLFKDSADATRYLVKRTGSPLVYKVNISAFNSMTASKEPPALGAGAGVPADPAALDEDGPSMDADAGDAPVGTDNAAVMKSRDAVQTR